MNAAEAVLMGQGAMAAILALPREPVVEICEEVNLLLQVLYKQLTSIALDKSLCRVSCGSATATEK